MQTIKLDKTKLALV